MSNTEEWKLHHFRYDLPDDLIAQNPAEPRDHSRLLVYERATGKITDDYFYNIPNHLPDSTLLVLNNAKVDKARLKFGNKEVFVIRQFDPYTVEAMVRPGKKFRIGRKIALSDKIEAEVLDVAEDGLRRIRFNHDLSDSTYDPYRLTPFPPYIRQDETLSDHYQTIYAQKQGSKAAPTAGLHFTDRVFNQLDQKGITRTEVTLHVGLGTFAPVKTENLDEHKMHSEEYEIDKATAELLNQAEHITAVGTTSARTLEAARRQDGFHPERKATDIFITPGYQFKAVDAMITNFHLPESTLLMMICAFAGYEETMQLYEHAIRERYRFYSFGDAMLIL